MSDHPCHSSVRRGTAVDLASLLPLVSEFCAVDGHDFDEQVLAAARAAGASRMFLETEEGNTAARRFYARAGFDVEESVWMQRSL